jgi:histidinol-phosphate/aromatic aminotransferase/cobyric acid decarboxylase-like protein
MVVDSNFMQREELRSYLAASTENYAVLTDYAAMEAYKDDILALIFHSMEIVADYPKQVIILKATSIVCGLTGT